MKNQAAVELGKLGGSVKSERKAITSSENGKKGGRPTLYEQAKSRMDDMNFTNEQMDFIFADWPEGNEHYKWLLSTTKEEIEDWIEAGE